MCKTVIKKSTIRFDLENTLHRQAYEILVSRNCFKYKTIADYIAPAVIEYAKLDEEKTLLEKLDKQKLIWEILKELEERTVRKQEPGI